MGVWIKVKYLVYYAGNTPDLLFALFSTIAYRLEGQKWGSRFPLIMNELYNGRLATEHAAEAVVELTQIQEELSQLTPDEMIWDFEDLTKQAPAWDRENPRITNLATAFRNEDNENVLAMMLAAVEESVEFERDVLIEARFYDSTEVLDMSKIDASEASGDECEESGDMTDT